MVAGVDLSYNRNASAMQMAQEIFGDGVNVLNASYTGDRRSSAIYSNGDSVAPGVTPSDTGVILSTGRADRFTNNSSQSNLSSSTTSRSRGPNNDPDFNALAGTNTYDASYMDIDFVADPGVNFISMNFVFSSEEYPEFVNSIYNDIVGVWVDGQPVSLSVGSGQANVGNVNPVNNLNLYNDNTADQFNTEMDGFTVTMSLTIPVTPGQVTSLRVGIADVGDENYDSNLLIAGNSVQGTLVVVDDSDTIGVGATKTIDVLANDLNATGGTLTITEINGQPVVAGQSITLSTGQTVTLNANGTFSFTADQDIETVNFTYGITSSTGDFDVGFVTIDTVPCFVAGTRVRTPNGKRRVEALEPGDMVSTHDDGAQPVRWIGRRRLPATGSMAPIRIDAGTFGDHGALMISPLHRVLIRDEMAELLFGEAEVLVAARDLVNDRSVRPVSGGFVDYVHLLFDDHQIVFSEGLATESFLPGSQTTGCFEAELIDEICTIFPELDPRTGQGYGPAARRTLKPYEAQLLSTRMRAA